MIAEVGRDSVAWRQCADVLAVDVGHPAAAPAVARALLDAYPGCQVVVCLDPAGRWVLVAVRDLATVSVRSRAWCRRARNALHDARTGR